MGRFYQYSSYFRSSFPSCIMTSTILIHTNQENLQLCITFMSGLSFPFPRLHAYARMIRKAVLKTLSETRVWCMLNRIMSSSCMNACRSTLPMISQISSCYSCLLEHVCRITSLYLFCTHTACMVICFLAVADCWFGRSVYYIWSGPVRYAGDPERRTTHIRADLNFISAGSRDHTNDPNTCRMLKHRWNTESACLTV